MGRKRVNAQWTYPMSPYGLTTRLSTLYYMLYLSKYFICGVCVCIWWSLFQKNITYKQEKHIAVFFSFVFYTYRKHWIRWINTCTLDILRKYKICILFLIGISHSESINYFPGFMTLLDRDVSSSTYLSIFCLCFRRFTKVNCMIK